MAAKNNQILDNIRYATTKLIVGNKQGETSLGTGFFFSFDMPEDKLILLLVTNKHIAKDWLSLKFRLNKADENGNPLLGDAVEFTLTNDGTQDWIEHPDVDLCVFPVWDKMGPIIEGGTMLCYREITKEFIPNATNINIISSIEDILMVGYPDGMADDAHNLPIVRRGITATDYKIDYEGRREFLIDAAIFKGSSGSPIFICDIGSYNNADGELCLGNRVLFLGVQYRGEFSKFQQNIYIRDNNGNYHNTPDVLSAYFNDLGFCVKSECLLWFREEIIRLGWK